MDGLERGKDLFRPPCWSSADRRPVGTARARKSPAFSVSPDFRIVRRPPSLLVADHGGRPIGRAAPVTGPVALEPFVHDDRFGTGRRAGIVRGTRPIFFWPASRSRAGKNSRRRRSRLRHGRFAIGLGRLHSRPRILASVAGPASSLRWYAVENACPKPLEGSTGSPRTVVRRHPGPGRGSAIGLDPAAGAVPMDRGPGPWNERPTPAEETGCRVGHGKEKRVCWYSAYGQSADNLPSTAASARRRTRITGQRQPAEDFRQIFNPAV